MKIDLDKLFKIEFEYQGKLKKKISNESKTKA